MSPGRLVAATLCLLFATACSQSLTVPDRVPEPLVETLPLRAGLLYTPAFADYRHTETAEGKPAWDIGLGAAHVGLFDRLGKRLFRDTAHISTLPGAENPADFDVIIEPAIDAFEISLPDQSTSDQYAVWIRYTLRVYGPQGELIAAWKLSGYGEAGKSTLKPASSMEQATVLAMRDAAATISIEFAGQPGIDELLREKSDASTDEKN
ncbi:MAG: hypothetical protein R3F27_01530 [Gammaproteobacteria bacterium]